VTVALSGLGGDEAFCGYERYLGFRLSQYFNRLPGWFRSGAVLPLVNALSESGGGGTRVNHLKRFVRSSGEEEARRYLGFVMKIGQAYRDALFVPESGINPEALAAVEDRFLAHYRGADAEDPLDRVVSCDVHTYLADDILALTDRLSMCHSLEVRVPFLDHELFEFCATIPSEMKLRWFRKKYVLKKALRDTLPTPVLTHRKQGFVGPMAQWLRGDLRRYTEAVLSRRELARHGLLDQGTVERVLSDHFEGRETNDTLIWSLVVFQVWFNLYMDNRMREPLEAARV
jgi:asparagine synthase (glutamine-hydrolysing)